MENLKHCDGDFPIFPDRHKRPIPFEQSGLSRIFYKSDFSVWLANPTGDFVTPFTLNFYVRGVERVYTACFDGETYTRCKRNSDGSLIVFFDRHSLPCGRLMLCSEIYRSNPDYEDGEQNVADNRPLPILLYDGPTSYDPTMAYALAPYIIGEKGDAFTYEDLTDEQKAELFEDATKDFAATVQRSYNAADKEAMEAIADPKEGDLCTLTSGDVYTYHLGEWVENADGGSGFTVLPAWISNLESEKTYTAEEVEALGGNVEELKVLFKKNKPFLLGDLSEGGMSLIFTASYGAFNEDGWGLFILSSSVSVQTSDICRMTFEFGSNGSLKCTTEEITLASEQELEEKADASDLVNVQRSYTAADKAAMDAITYPKEGDLCSCLADSSVRDNLANVKAGDVITKIVSISRNPQDIADYISALDSAMPSSVYGYYNSEGKDIITYRPDCNMTVGDETISRSEFAQYKNGAVVGLFNSLPEDRRKVAKIIGITDANAAAGSVIESPVLVDVLRSNVFVYHKGAWTLQEEKAGKATTPALLTAADADAMNALTTAKDGDRCIVGGNAIYDRVGGKWYFTAGVQPAKTVKASELKAGDKIKTVNFDTSKTPEGTGDGVFCTIGGVPIEMLAFIDSLSYGTGKTPLFTGTWNTTNTAACSAAMAGKTVDSVATSMAALSANVDDWLSFEIDSDLDSYIQSVVEAYVNEKILKGEW